MVRPIRQLALALLVVGAATVAGVATESGEQRIPADSTRLLLRVGKLSVFNRKIYDTIPVTLTTFGSKVAGFDLKIGSDNPNIQIIDVLPGEIYDSCHWGYFHQRQINMAGQRYYPASLWQVVGLAQNVGDTAGPSCYGMNREASLVKIVVSNQHVLRMPETKAAFFFFWERCADNVLSGPSGEQLYMSLNVVDYYPANLEEPSGGFPTRRGAPRQCVSPRALNRPRRNIEFSNGGVRFQYNADSLRAPANPIAPVPGTPFSPDSAGNSPR